MSKSKKGIRAPLGANPRSTRGRVCGVCIAGLVSGMASGGIAMRKRAKAQGRSGGADAALYRASFDRPRGKGVAARFWLSPAGYDTLVKLEAEALTRAQIEDAMRRWKVGARVYRRATGEPVWNLSVKPSGDIVVDVDWERVRREQRESALRGPKARGKSAGVWIGAAAALAALAAYTLTLPKVDRPPHGDGPGYYVFLFDKQWDGPYPTRTAAEDRADEAFDFWNRPGGGARGMARPTVRHLERAPFSESKGSVSGLTRKGRSGGQAVAEGILEQLGGRKFLAMTAATKLLSFNEPGHGGLQFKLPRRGARAKLGIDAVRITLELSDTYTMDFYKGMEKVRLIGSLYSDDLRRVFTEVTGLETSLGTMGRAAGEYGGDSWRDALRWLGGQKFITMTGATNVRSLRAGEEFDLPKGAARLGIDHVEIRYYPLRHGLCADKYAMDFFKGGREVYSADPIRGEDLRRKFTEVTGLPHGADGDLGGRAAGKKDPKELVSWGVFPYTPDSSPSAGDPVPDTRRGYVAREVNRETGRGTHWPYSRVQAVKIYWRRHLADAYATELTYGRKKP